MNAKAIITDRQIRFKTVDWPNERISVEPAGSFFVPAFSLLSFPLDFTSSTPHRRETVYHGERTFIDLIFIGSKRKKGDSCADLATYNLEAIESARTGLANVFYLSQADPRKRALHRPI